MSACSVHEPNPPPAPSADLTGTTGKVILGSLSGLPQDGDAGAYSGTADLDWWYTVAAASIDGSRNPFSQLAGSYTAKTLDARATSTCSSSCRAVPANLEMWNVKLTAAVGGVKPGAAVHGPRRAPGVRAPRHDQVELRHHDRASCAATSPRSRSRASTCRRSSRRAAASPPARPATRRPATRCSTCSSAAAKPRAGS